MHVLIIIKVTKEGSGLELMERVSFVDSILSIAMPHCMVGFSKRTVNVNANKKVQVKYRMSSIAFSSYVEDKKELPITTIYRNQS